VTVGDSCSGLLENPCPPWLEQPRGEPLGLEPHVALEEADGGAIGAEVVMRTSKRIPSNDAQHRVLQGFGDRHGPLAMLDCLGATSHKTQCQTDRGLHQGFAAGIVQGFSQRLGFELKLNPACKFSERTQARAYCQAQIYRLLQGGFGLRQMRQHGNGLLQV
jgi:hypothetical protein